jgi:intein-encoded DNA endonuclease-like protein
MPTQSRQELADMAMGGRLESYLSGKRENGWSYRNISRDLAEHHNILCSHVTVMEWCRELGIS